MAGTTYGGTITTGIILDDPGTQRPVTVTGTVTNVGTDAVYGTPAFAWTVNNQGTVQNTGIAGYGIHLAAGGTVNNLVQQSVSPGGPTGGSLIQGYGGILIQAAVGGVTNLGLIEATGANADGINMTAGGTVSNGSASNTLASISGGRHGISIEGGAAAVTNFGTVQNTDIHSAIVFHGGGSITNGSSASTTALISNTGSGGAIYVSDGIGTVTNFGTIRGSDGLVLLDGGRVTNGQSGSTAGLIVGATSNAITIAGTAGTVANFGTVQATGTVSAIHLNAGGSVTNGAVGAPGALISGTGTGIYAGNLPTTVTNFGRITAGGSGIALEFGGTVTNSGTVQSSNANDADVYLRGGGSVTNSKTGAIVGLISGAGDGISVLGGAGTVTNSGSIQSSTATGIYLNRGGTVTNQAGGVIAGKVFGVYNRGVAITVTNAGLIETTGTAEGVYLRGGGSITNNEGGTIAGGAAGIELGQQGGTVTNHGVIKGVIGFYGGTHHQGNNTLINFGTVASTSTAANAVAVEMGGGDGSKVLIVEKGAVFTGLVEGGGRGKIEFAATGTAAMGGNISGFNTVALANGGADSLTLVTANFTGVDGRITVMGGNDGNKVNASTVKTGQLTIDGGTGTDVLTGSANGNTIFVFKAAALTAADKITGSNFNNELDVTTPGTVAVSGVTGVQLYQLANGGANSLTLTNANFTGVLARPVDIYGGTGGNTINGSALTGTTDNLEIFGGAGPDVLKGGAGSDIFVFAAAALTGTDTVSGGGGSNELLMTTAGTVAAAKVSGIETYVLADGAANTLTLGNGNFTGVTGSSITISDGNNGNTVNASGEKAADRITVYAGTGADVLTGGPGNDWFYAGGGTTMTGGAGSNEFIFSAPGTNTITDFAASKTNAIDFSNSGFNLGLTGTGLLPSGLFITGAFNSGSQRFSYVGGQLFYSPTGSTATEMLVATLTGAPALSASDLFHTPTTAAMYSGVYTTLISLGNPATQRTATVTGSITDATDQGIFGNADFAWTINNRGSIVSTSTTTGESGIQLIAGGTVNNLVAASATTHGSLIAGYNNGVLIQFAPGTVSNLGEIEDTGINGVGVNLVFGGAKVVNGSAAVTTASISGPGTGVLVSGGAGVVTNFGTVAGTGTHTTIFLKSGGDISNGSSTSTAALIANTGSASGVYVGYGAGTVTNFGAIKGAATGVVFNDGGQVTNGASGLTAGLIEGGTGGGVSIAGAAGTVVNFGAVENSSVFANIALLAGGTVTNGAVGATSASITGTGTAVYINNAPGTVTNFGNMTSTSTVAGTAVVFEDGGSLTNFGTVQNNFTTDAGVYFRGGGSVTNSKTGASVGLISGAGTGVSIRGGVGTVTNSGSITSATANGIFLNGGGTVTNQAGGVITGHTNGVYNRGVAITAMNSGLIETTGTADGIYLRGGGSVTNAAGGTIKGGAAGIATGAPGGTVTNRGLIEGVVGFVPVSSGGANTLINYGTVASTAGTTGVAVNMASNIGSKVLIVEPGAVFIGLVEGGGLGEIEFAAAGTAAMGSNISGFSTVALANGAADSLTLTNANFTGVSPGRITVIGGNSGNTVDASAVISGAVTIDGGAGTDMLKGGGGNDIFVFAATALTAADAITGGGGTGNELQVTTAGTVTAKAVSGVSGVEVYRLANGGTVGNSLTLANANFAGVLGGHITVYGGTGGIGNTVDGSGLTGTGDNLVIYAGNGADVLKGGAGSDTFVFTAAALTATDTVSGGGGNNELLMTTAGTVAAAKVSGVESYVLADGAANTLTLGSANFAGVTGSTITVSDGNHGNTVSVGAGVAAPDQIIIYAGTGADKLTGGPGSDVFYAGGDTSMTGKGGTNEFIFSAPGISSTITNTITDFTASTTNEMEFISGTGFVLPGATATPMPLDGLFIQDSTGTFTTASQRFAYGKSNGNLYYSASGTTAGEHLVTHLTGNPTLSPSEISHLLFAS
jgi:Ca2+-binding RTX toxin-like protein